MSNNNQEQKAYYGNTTLTRVSISNYEQLLTQIEILREEKDFQEDKLKNSFSEMLGLLNIMSLFKAATKQEQPLELAKTGLNMILTLIIDLVLGKHRSIKGYLSAVMVEKFTTVLINNNLINIITGISSLFNRKTQYERSQEF
ncbi:MAG: hypothetical protein JXR27_03830 [Paludibacteraceae bacterium]|nr:hypothetical protein [Paludibacteraceae bacterium]